MFAEQISVEIRKRQIKQGIGTKIIWVTKEGWDILENELGCLRRYTPSGYKGIQLMGVPVYKSDVEVFNCLLINNYLLEPYEF